MTDTSQAPHMKGDGRYRRSPSHGDDRGHGRLIRGLTSCFLTAEPVIDR
jgi:hypothetical protein